MMAAEHRVRRSRGALSGVVSGSARHLGRADPVRGTVLPLRLHARPRLGRHGRPAGGLRSCPVSSRWSAGVVVLISRFRPAAVFGAWLGGAGGRLVRGGQSDRRGVDPHPAALARRSAASPAPALEQIGFFTGLGVVIVFVAALALGRFTVVAARDKAAAVAADATGDKVVDDTAARETVSAAATRTTAQGATSSGVPRQAAQRGSERSGGQGCRRSGYRRGEDSRRVGQRLRLNERRRRVLTRLPRPRLATTTPVPASV